tara:strand:- start:866 stop:1069 length:204 start_codon:yes stop_codon:yes gene_type:complete
MKYTYEEVIYSDLFKSANGYRPRNDFYAESTTPERKQQLWNEMIRDLKIAEKRRTASFEGLAWLDLQ